MKRYWERQQEEGWTSAGDKHVCASCFSDYAIAAFVSANPVNCECSYCGAKSEAPIAAEMDEVLSFIAAGLNREYDDPGNCLPYETREGGWQLVEPTDGWDLVADGGWLNEDSSGFDELLDDLQHAFSDKAYVRRDPLIMSHSERLSYSWEAFCNTVKHKTRFVIFKVRPPRRTRLSYHPDDLSSVPVYQILEHLGRLASDLGLVKELPRRTEFIRARQHDSSTTPQTAAELGAPPPEKASQSRMSPAGISMFYAAADSKTAFLETFEPSASAKDRISFARFVTARTLRILDLTALPDIPSIFDEAKFDQRHDIIFIHAFARDISKPITRDGREHYEYVPTQIVAEYLRSVFRWRRQRIDGVAFNSSRKEAGCSYCLFADASGCADGFKDKTAPRLRFEKKNRIVVLRGVQCRSVSECVSDFT